MLPLAEAEALARELERRRSGQSVWCPHAPTPRQAEFLAIPDLEALYGGAAGGGKSDGLLMGFLQHVDEPHYSGIIFRRTYADLSLPGALMDRSHEWFGGSSASWNGLKRQWRFPSGAVLTFGYLDTDRDKYRYQSAEFQYIAFDELTQFPESSYRYMFSRLRKGTGSLVPLRMRAATNPGGLGHEWVKSRFIDGTCKFISAKLDDNPHADKPSYLESLAKLDPVTRRQLELGEWVQDASGMVYRAFTDANIVAGAPECEHHLLGIDFGFHDSCAFVTVGYVPNDPCLYVLQSHKQRGMIPDDAGAYVKELPFKYRKIVGDTSGLGKGYSEQMRQRFSIPVEPAEKINKAGFIDLLNGALSRGLLKIVRSTNEPLIDELRALAWNESRTKEVDGMDNHLCDALLYVWRASTAYLQKPRVDLRTVEQKTAEADARARYLQNAKHHDVPKHQSIDPIYDVD